MNEEIMDLSYINGLDNEAADEAFFRCSGSHVWTEAMVAQMPFATVVDLETKADAVWKLLSKQDWLDAFAIHPKIGDVENLRKKFATTASWASHEQSGANAAPDEVIQALAHGNKKYEDKFGHIFIVCATGKSAVEMLAILNERLHNADDVEFPIACNEQKKIAKIRLGKLRQ
jgi:2-oxo-4-hydroxy-4-carboxy-5-ureidoimidazoline decarboxylase